MRKKNIPVEEPKIINPYESVESYLEYLKKELEKVEVDLPFLEDLMDKKSTTNSVYTAEYENHPSSQFAALLGYELAGTLTRSISETNEYNLMYINTGNNPTEFDFVKANRENNYTRYSRKFRICPTFNFKNCPDAFDMLPFTKQGDEYVVFFGHYAMDAASTEYQTKLNNAFKNKQLGKPVDSFIIDGANREKYKSKFSPEKCLVYEFEGKKYVRYRVSDLGKTVEYPWGDRSVKKNTTTINEKEYKDGDIIWIEVLDIKCKANKEEKRLVSCLSLLKGIQFEEFNGTFDKIEYEKSFIKKFLNTFFKSFALKNAGKVYDNPTTISKIEQIINEHNRKNKEEEEKQKDKELAESQEKMDLTELLGRINDIKRYYLGNEDINEKIRTIYATYKRNIDKLYDSIEQDEDNLHLGTVIPETLYKGLINDLTYIYNILKKDYDKVIPYYQMLDLLTECQKEEINPNRGELCHLIHHAKSCLLPFITNQKRKHELANQLDTLIADNITTIEKYLEEIKQNPNIKTKTFEELGREYFDNYKDLMNEINEVVGNQEVVNDILDSTKLIMQNLYVEAKTDTARRFLNQLNEHISVIHEKGLERDIQMYKHQQKLNYDVKDIDQIIETLETNIKIAHRIELIIEDRLKRKDELKKFDFDLDLDSILTDEPKQNGK